MTIGEKIKMQRKSLGLTQTELGIKLGVQKNAVSKWECGRVDDIPSSKIKAMAQLFGVRPSYLIDDANTELPLSSEAQKIAKAFDKATPKDKSTVRLVLSEYLDDEVIELANVARTGVNITVTETLGEHESRRAATLHDIETLEDTKLP